MRLSNCSFSILKNSNKGFCHSSDDVSGLREGSYIRIGNDNIFYTVKKTNPIFLIKDFTSIHPQKIYFINKI